MELLIESNPQPFVGKVIRVYIATNYRHGKLGYALRYFNGREEKIFVGWIWSKQPPRAQMLAMHSLLSAVALHQKDVRLEIIMRRDYLRDRFSMAFAKDNNRQYGEAVSTTKEDQYPWRETYLLWMLYKKGMTPAREDADKAILGYLERNLEELAYRHPSPLNGVRETQPQITCDDVSEFPDEDDAD